MNLRRILFFSALILATLISILVLSRIPNASLLTTLAAFLPPILISLLGFVLTPLSIWLDKFLTGPRRNQECVIYLYGCAGSGKTSLANSWFSGEPASSGSTGEIKLYRSSRDTDQGAFNLLILDYKGQKQSQMTTRTPKKLKSILNRANAAVFIVDTVGRHDDSGYPLETEEQQIQWLSTDTENKIKKRVSEHSQYINGSLEIVFSIIVNSNLKSIRLAINKFDLFRKVHGYLPNPQQLPLEEHYKVLFQDIYDQLSKACHENKIHDFQVEIISAKHDEGTRRLLNGILDECSTSRSRTSI